MNARILIVEDEVVTRQTLTRLFQQEGYEVFDAADGLQMENIMRQERVDVVIMDVNLPGKNGLELAESLRESDNIGLIFLTGRDSEDDRLLALELGADDYLIKPYNPKELTIRVRNLCRRIEASRSGSPVENNSVEFQFHGWRLNSDSRCLYSPENQMFRLPKSEYRALEYFYLTRAAFLTVKHWLNVCWIANCVRMTVPLTLPFVAFVGILSLTRKHRT
ncbi:response regulator [Idiomarina loihiensis GSL 199]|uniref:Response regulator (CheY,wHTH domains) n=1 Tax=Idiomarina loihiensis (strain ATCC BAA-735 / DSM 15497 / L2-TR) TaxID=283942 RepID=Q5R051_IDILO|nr:Response regulator (CheY,wHTH domains) [Idiomarina loihiensis L2TR]AGM35359.1 response regulator [Idiomarina loihiensis GSL 199]